MISSSDVPACPACGCREVHPIIGVPRKLETAMIAEGYDDHIGEPGTLETLYACRQCGRDVTDAWADIQPAPEPEPVIGPPADPEPTETIAEAAARLGIAATANGSGS